MKALKYWLQIFRQEDEYIADAFRIDFFNALSSRVSQLDVDIIGLDKNTPWFENLYGIVLDNAAAGRIDYDILPVDYFCFGVKDDLELMPDLDDKTQLRIALNTRLKGLRDDKHFYELDSETKGMGDVARLMWLEDCLSLAKEIVGDDRKRV